MISRQSKWVVAIVVLVLALTTCFRSDVALTPAAVTCDSIGYDYDSAGRMVGVHDRTNLTARYAYDEVGNALAVERMGQPDLSVQSFVPVKAAVGASVTFSGGCFTDDPTDYEVEFNGVSAEVTAVSEHRLVATVPEGATTVPVTVAGNGTTVTTTENFVVSGSRTGPAIAAVEPAIVATGGILTVTGSGFAPVPEQNAVWLNSTVARVVSATTTTLSVLVPSGAASGRVRVRTLNGNATSTSDLFVAPAGLSVADVTYGQRRLGDGPQTVNLPPTGKVALLVFDLARGERASIVTAGSTSATRPAAVVVRDPFGRSVPVSSTAVLNPFVDAFSATVAGTYTAVSRFTRAPARPGR